MRIMSDGQDPWGGDNRRGEMSPAKNEFFDNFAPVVSNGSGCARGGVLPDHEEYLERLESKLANLSKKSNLVKDLAARRSDEARRMLEAGSINTDSEGSDVNCQNGRLSRKLFPEKQALTLTELVHLVEADALAIKSEAEGAADRADE